MAFYAKKIKYVAGDECGAYVALIAIAKKKGGKPSKFVLYRFLSVGPLGIFDSVEFPSSQEKNARKAFPCGPIVYRPIEEELEGAQDLIRDGCMARTPINPWNITTDWLNSVAVGGAYEVYPKGTWVKLRKHPYTWRKDGPRKKKRSCLKFGDLGHILLKRKLELEGIKEELVFLLNDIGDEGEIERIEEKENELAEAEMKVERLLAEMEYVRGKKPHQTTQP